MSRSIDFVDRKQMQMQMQERQHESASNHLTRSSEQANGEGKGTIRKRSTREVDFNLRRCTCKASNQENVNGGSR